MILYKYSKISVFKNLEETAMAMSVYRVNSAYLRTSGINNQKHDKSFPGKKINFEKASTEGFVQTLIRLLKLTPKHANDNFLQNKSSLRDDVWLRGQFHGGAARAGSGE